MIVGDEMDTNIYADFNGIEECRLDPNMLCLDLTGYGTLASLSLHKVKLKEGLFLVFNDPEGLSVRGITYFDQDKVSGNCSGWFARIQSDDIIENEPLEHDYDTHTCFTCRKNIKPYLDKIGRQFKENCPFCDTSIMLPLSPPDNLSE